MESASNSTVLELERFFDYLYGDQTGYVYSPVKDPNTENFEKYFFRWPVEKDYLIKHIIKLYPTHEVYYSPALFAEASDADNIGKKETFKGSYFVWAEFDGELPQDLQGVPEPSLKIQSSVSGHEHWYWKLDKFVTDRSVVENISQRLAYHLSADLGCWNANRVLRPPGTLHHESQQQVTALRLDSRSTSIIDFAEVPELPVKLLQENDFGHVPVALKVISQYAWSDDSYNLFTSTPEKGQRSSALTKVAHYCVEMGMSNAETLSILLSADNRWKKFIYRKNQKKCLIDIINYVRAKHPVDPAQEEIKPPRLQVYTHEEFMNTEVEIEWLIEGILHKKGLFSVSGPPDSGKSQISLRFAEKMAKMDKFLKWNSTRPIKTLFVSMEMPHEELKYVLDVMAMKDPNGLLRENFLLLPLGYSIGLKNSKSRYELMEVMEKFQPDVIMLDSLGVAISDEISSDKVVFEAFDFVHKVLRNHFGSTVWFIHHTRKEQIGNKKPNKLDDLYGSRYISAALTGAINLWPVGPEIEVSCLKMRLAEKFKPFRMKRSPGIDFSLVHHHVAQGTSIMAAASSSDLDDSDLGMSI